MKDNSGILITGATGFVGRHLLPEVIKRFPEIYCLVRKTSDTDYLKNTGARLRYGDLTDKPSLEGCLDGVGIIIHLAVLMSDKDYLPLSEFIKVNVEATRNLAELAEGRVQHFIYISTVGVYGAIPLDGVSESAGYGLNLSKYEYSKAEGEKVILSFGSKGSLPFTILRLGQLYGPYMDYGWLDVLRKIESGKMFIPGKGDALLQLTYISDAVSGIINSIGNDRCKGKIINLCADKAYPVQEIFGEFARQLNKPAPKHLAFQLLYFIALILKLIPYKFKPGGLKYLDIHRLNFFCCNHVYNINAARDMLGYSPEVDLRAGISKLIGWYRERKEGKKWRIEKIFL